MRWWDALLGPDKKADTAPRQIRRLGAESALRGLPVSTALSAAPGPYVPLQRFRSPGSAAPSRPHQQMRCRDPEARPQKHQTWLTQRAKNRGRQRKRFYRLSPMTLKPPSVLSSDWLIPLQCENKPPNQWRLSCTKAFIGDLGKCTKCWMERSNENSGTWIGLNASPSTKQWAKKEFQLRNLRPFLNYNSQHSSARDFSSGVRKFKLYVCFCVLFCFL